MSGGIVDFSITDATQQDWQQALLAYPEANFLQSWRWTAFYEARGNTVLRRIVRQGTEVVAMWSGIVQDARRGRYLEIAGGPLLDWKHQALADVVLRDIAQQGKHHHCVFVRVRPQLHETPDNETLFVDSLQRLSHRVRRSPMHLHAEHTNILDITSDEETLLAGMRRQTRYEVRRSTRRDVVVTSRPATGNITTFYDMQADTAQRQGFVPPSRSFLETYAETFGDALQLYTAEKDGVILNAALVIIDGPEAVYHEAASIPQARKEPGAYGLLWQAIQDAKAAGAKRFNFWGIAYTSDPNHRYAGVTTFKRGFGGQDVSFIPAYDIILSRPKYLKNWIVETTRKKRRKL